MRLPSVAGAVLLLLLRAVPIVYVQSASSCTAVPAVASCVSSITSLISRTASVSKFCSSVLECPLPTTTTLVGTVSTTTTKTQTSTYTLEEIGTETTTTSTFSYTRNGVLFEPQYTPDKGTASIFILDSKGRIVTQTSYGDHFFASDDYDDFELMHILPRGWIQARRGHNGEDAGFDYVYCTMQRPSGRYVGGFKELACTQGYFNATVLQYCPLYDEYFHTGTVLGAEYSATTPDCLLVTYLVVPVC
ncbi:hypothetical protein CMEL01_08327 [Colletotrichum melonis]|uniref:Uncharacterized protein n=1 Tax=Colletotrichum melonis TaxID=1209925 RepID=A0AAI9XI26_9PEZI|nr:hypothetical protein CMEL01_08327 [Colletotrichum melonis]